MPKQGREILNPSQPALEVNAGRKIGCLYSQDPWVGRGTVSWEFGSIRRNTFLRPAPDLPMDRVSTAPGSPSLEFHTLSKIHFGHLAVSLAK